MTALRDGLLPEHQIELLDLDKQKAELELRREQTRLGLIKQMLGDGDESEPTSEGAEGDEGEQGQDSRKQVAVAPRPPAPIVTLSKTEMESRLTRHRDALASATRTIEAARIRFEEQTSPKRYSTEAMRQASIGEHKPAFDQARQ